MVFSSHKSRLMLLSAVMAFLFLPLNLGAATSYLLVQGQFTAGGDVETFRWRVDYTGNTLLSGQDLLDKIFGASPSSPVSNTDYNVGNSSLGVLYRYYAGYGLSPQGFSIGGSSLITPPYSPSSYSPYWSYYNAGGGYMDLSNLEPYSTTEWTYAETGIRDRLLADTNGTSYDAWVFTEYDPVAGSAIPANNFTGTASLISSGTGYTVYQIAAAPEPTRVLLAALGFGALLMRRNRVSR